MIHTSILGVDVASEKLDLCFNQDPATHEHSQIEYSIEALDQFLSL